MNQRRSYTPEFKEEAVREEAVRLANERGFSQAARDLGINVSLIRRWKNHLNEDGERPFPGRAILAMRRWPA